jgi:plasmid stabilization system protein ParE
MEIRWSIPAAEDLIRICTWIERDSPQAARRVASTIFNGVAQLGSMPGLGRPSTRLNGWRELVFAPLPYIAVYRIRENVVEIARIYHGAQDWP